MAALRRAPAVPAPDHLVQERLLHAYLRVLSARDWQERLAPLAQHMVERRLVRAPDRGGDKERPCSCCGANCQRCAGLHCPVPS